MKSYILVFLSLFLTESTWAKAEKWVIDVEHTRIGFSVAHLVISTVEGSFKTFQGTIDFNPKFDKKDIKDFSTEIRIESNSVDTGITKRDDHLRSKDFFDVSNFQQIVFKSEKFVSSDGKNFKIHGMLTVAGKTKPVKLNAVFLGTAKAYDIQRVAFKASTQIKREDFGLTWNDLVESGPVIGSNIDIVLHIEAKRKADLE